MREYYYDWEDLGDMVFRRKDDPRWVDPSRTLTKQQAPYSYSEFFIFGNREIIVGKDALYSDRIFEWDHEKASRLWKKHIDGRWESAGAVKLSEFLSEYLNYEVRVYALAEGCNVSNGYPYWIVWYSNVETENGDS